MASETRRFPDKMKESHPKKWIDEERRRARFAFQKVCAYVVQTARVIVSTNKNLAGEYVRQNVGHNSEMMVLIRDEDPKKWR